MWTEFQQSWMQLPALCIICLFPGPSPAVVDRGSEDALGRTPLMIAEEQRDTKVDSTAVGGLE